jgi:hypothetical protein
MRKWQNWAPAGPISSDRSVPEHTKPTEPGSVGFVSSVSGSLSAQPTDDVPGSPGPIDVNDWNSALELPTRRCRACKSDVFWLSVYGAAICSTCHPPANPGIVRAWFRLTASEGSDFN